MSLTVEDARFYALRTFRRDGTPVMTPVWAAFEGATGVVLTGRRSFKVRRICLTARVEVAPSDFRGAARGDWRAGTARVLDGSQHRRAILQLRRKYGLQFRIFHALLGFGGRRRRSGDAVTLELELERVDG